MYTVNLHDVDYARVYLGLIPIPEDIKEIQIPLNLSCGEGINLLGYDLINPQIKPGEELLVASYWKFLQTLPPQAKINITLYEVNGKFKQTSQISLVNNYISLDQIPLGTIIRDVHRLKIDFDLQLATYQIGLEGSISEQDKQPHAKDSQDKLLGNKGVITEIELVKF